MDVKVCVFLTKPISEGVKNPNTGLISTETGGVEPFKAIMDAVGTGLDAAGVVVIVVGAIYASLVFLRQIRQTGAYIQYRQSLGRAILLGLEFLVAGDIIRTVAVSPTFSNVIVLAAIVLIRTFLSTALQLEIEGIWPWQQKILPKNGENLKP